MWGWFLIRSQDWSLSHIQGWSLGHSQGEVPMVVNWHPVVPGRSGLGRAVVGEMVASHWVALGVRGLLHDHIHSQDLLLANYQHQQLEGLGVEHWCPQQAEVEQKSQEEGPRERAGRHLGDRGL